MWGAHTHSGLSARQPLETLDLSLLSRVFYSQLIQLTKIYIPTPSFVEPPVMDFQDELKKKLTRHFIYETPDQFKAANGQ